LAVGGAEIGALDGVEQIAAGAVRRAPARAVGERQEQAAAITLEPVQGQLEGAPGEGEAGGSEAAEPVRLAGARRELELGGLGRNDIGSDPEVRVVAVVGEAAERGPAGVVERRLAMLGEQAVARLP